MELNITDDIVKEKDQKECENFNKLLNTIFVDDETYYIKIDNKYIFGSKERILNLLNDFITIDKKLNKKIKKCTREFYERKRFKYIPEDWKDQYVLKKELNFKYLSSTCICKPKYHSTIFSSYL